MSQQIPIVNLPFLYMNNMIPAYDDDTVLVVSAGQCRDSNNIMDIVIEDEIELDTDVVGLNGIDTGVLVVSKWYKVYAIACSSGLKPTGVILSLATNSAPSLPFSYDSYRQVGVVKTDSGADFLPFYITGNGTDRTFWFESPDARLSGGTQSDYTAIDLDIDDIIDGSSLINVQYSYTPTAAASLALFRPSDSVSTSNNILKGAVDDVAIEGVMPLMAFVSGANGIAYKLSSGDALSIGLSSFTLSL